MKFLGYALLGAFAGALVTWGALALFRPETTVDDGTRAMEVAAVIGAAAGFLLALRRRT